MSDLSFAVATFTTVFDTVPLQDCVGLAELSHSLRRFELKPKLRKQEVREVQRIDTAYEAWRSGGQHQGKWWTRLRKAQREAERLGEDPSAAVKAMRDKLAKDAHKNIKKDMRLWAPSLFDGRRESDCVVHMSCLVVDYDEGDVHEASETWAPWYRLVHTTWSHRPEHHKFRIILPLLNPVLPEDWEHMWTWVADFATGFDPSSKSLGTTFALPVIASADAPHHSAVHEGPLLDPLMEGIVSRSAPLIQVPRLPAGTSIFRDGDPAKSYLDPDAESADLELEVDPAEDLWEDWNLGASSAVASEPSARIGESSAEVLLPVLERLEAKLSPAMGLVDALERLAALHDRGKLSDREFEAAKSRLVGEA